MKRAGSGQNVIDEAASLPERINLLERFLALFGVAEMTDLVNPIRWAKLALLADSRRSTLF
jgi:hypothetical protein